MFNVIMSIEESQFRSMSVDEMWLAYSNLKLDREALDQLTDKLKIAIDKINYLEVSVTKIESELSISKTVNSALKDSVRNLQIKVAQMDQYHRRDNIEISGVPEDAENLESKSVKLLNKINVKVSSSDLVACHRLKKKGSIIVKFLNRKNADLAIKNRNILRNVDTSSIWGSNCVNYINTNLSPDNLKIRWYARKFKAANLIASFGVNAKGVWIVGKEGERKRNVFLKEDLDCFVPADVSFDSIVF